MGTIFFYIYKIIMNLLLSNMFFIAIILVAIILLIKNKKKLATILLIILALMMYFLSISPVANFIAKSLESKFLPITKNQVLSHKALILLGGGIQNFKLNNKNYTDVPITAYRRIIEVVRVFYLAKQNHILYKIFVTGGEVFQKIIPEALLYKEVLMNLGVPSKDIVIETKSKTTYENAKFLSQILKEHKYKAYLLVTSAFQMKRAVYCFKKFNINIVPDPVGYMQNKETLFFIPQFKNLEKFSTVLWEDIGMLYYRIRY